MQIHVYEHQPLKLHKLNQMIFQLLHTCKPVLNGNWQALHPIQSAKNHILQFYEKQFKKNGLTWQEPMRSKNAAAHIWVRLMTPRYKFCSGCWKCLFEHSSYPCTTNSTFRNRWFISGKRWSLSMPVAITDAIEFLFVSGKQAGRIQLLNLTGPSNSIKAISSYQASALKFGWKKLRIMLYRQSFISFMSSSNAPNITYLAGPLWIKIYKIQMSYEWIKLTNNYGGCNVLLLKRISH